ncbi:MAG: SPW repeat protein [Flavisolibacter sp.]|nr:SPW repeat protein [Flavisolibacter sp.]
MWSCIATIIIGLWLMISPSVLGMTQSAANNNHIVGPLVITFAVIALWEINRNVIKVNILIGAWLIIAPFLIDFAATTAIISNIVAAIAIIFLSLIKREVKQHYGGGWVSLSQPNPPHLREAENELT